VRIRRLWAGGGLGLERPGSVRSYLSAAAFCLSLAVFLLLRARRHDVIHVHHVLFPGVIAAAAAHVAGRPLVFHSGRLAVEKGHEVLLKAIRRVDVRLVLAGDGALRGEIGRRAGELGVSERVEFLGEIEDVTPWLARAAVFALPSFGEGMSNALLEAMAAGLPCVVSDVPGNAELVQHDLNGLLFESGDEDALAGALERVISDPTLARRLGTQARRTIEARAAFDRVVDRYVALYARLTAEPAARCQPGKHGGLPHEDHGRQPPAASR